MFSLLKSIGGYIWYSTPKEVPELPHDVLRSIMIRTDVPTFRNMKLVNNKFARAAKVVEQQSQVLTPDIWELICSQLSEYSDFLSFACINQMTARVARKVTTQMKVDYALKCLDTSTISPTEPTRSNQIEPLFHYVPFRRRYLGPVRPDRGLVRPDRGLVRPDRGLVRPDRGLVRPVRGLVRRRVRRPTRRRTSHRQRRLAWNSGR